MAVCENYKCIQRKRECKKLLQGWSKQLLSFVGKLSILSNFFNVHLFFSFLKPISHKYVFIDYVWWLKFYFNNAQLYENFISESNHYLPNGIDNVLDSHSKAGFI